MYSYPTPLWMHVIIETLVSRQLALRLTNGVKNENGYEFKAKIGSFHCTEFAKTPEMVVLNCEFDKAKQAVLELIGTNWQQLVDNVEEYVSVRGKEEDLRIHRCIVQLVVARAEELHNHGQLWPLVVSGDFGLIGRLSPNALLKVFGNVDTIEGSTGTDLSIFGNVESIGCGPFWSPNPVSGSHKSYLKICGNLHGYKTGIQNPELTINIHGDVTVEGGFIYRPSEFKKLTVHGDLHTKNGICPGLMKGDLCFMGEAPHLLDDLKESWARCSGGSVGKGNVFLKGWQVVKDGKLIV